MTKIQVTTTDKMLPRIGRSVIIGDIKIALFQTTKGDIYALEDFCPLTGGPILEGIVSSEFLYEPMRDYKISLIDGQLQDPDEGQIRTFPVTVEGEKVYIEM